MRFPYPFPIQNAPGKGWRIGALTHAGENLRRLSLAVLLFALNLELEAPGGKNGDNPCR